MSVRFVHLMCEPSSIEEFLRTPDIKKCLSFPQGQTQRDERRNLENEANGEIYKWKDDFRYVTIVVCIYTEAVIILVHLTCSTIFLYTTQKTTYIAGLKYIFELLFNIGTLIKFHLIDTVY